MRQANMLLLPACLVLVLVVGLHGANGQDPDYCPAFKSCSWVFQNTTAVVASAGYSTASINLTPATSEFVYASFSLTLQCTDGFFIWSGSGRAMDCGANTVTVDRQQSPPDSTTCNGTFHKLEFIPNLTLRPTGIKSLALIDSNNLTWFTCDSAILPSSASNSSTPSPSALPPVPSPSPHSTASISLSHGMFTLALAGVVAMIASVAW